MYYFFCLNFYLFIFCFMYLFFLRLASCRRSSPSPAGSRARGSSRPCRCRPGTSPPHTTRTSSSPAPSTVSCYCLFALASGRDQAQRQETIQTASDLTDHRTYIHSRMINIILRNPYFVYPPVFWLRLMRYQRAGGGGGAERGRAGPPRQTNWQK